MSGWWDTFLDAMEDTPSVAIGAPLLTIFALLAVWAVFGFHWIWAVRGVAGLLCFWLFVLVAIGWRFTLRRRARDAARELGIDGKQQRSARPF